MQDDNNAVIMRGVDNELKCIKMAINALQARHDEEIT